MKKRKLQTESTGETKQKKQRTEKDGGGPAMDQKENLSQAPTAPVVIAPAAVDYVAAVAAKNEMRSNATLSAVAASVPIDAVKQETAGYLDSIIR